MNATSEIWEDDERYIRQYGIDNGIMLTEDMVDEFCEWVFDLVRSMNDHQARELALQQLKQRYEI